MMPALQGIDYIALGVYIAAMIGIGTAFYRKDSSVSDYFVAGRNMPAGSFLSHLRPVRPPG
jgi:Na+/proline symporter